MLQSMGRKESDLTEQLNNTIGMKEFSPTPLNSFGVTNSFLGILLEVPQMF